MFSRALLGLLLLTPTLFPCSGCSAESNSQPIKLSFTNPDGSKTVPFMLEVRKTIQERGRGLMYRREMAPDEGMLFIFPDEAPRSFWMKNTYLSLDMLFLDSDLRVVSLLESVPPLNTEPRRSAQPAKYVVELNAGTARKHRILVGSQAHTTAQLPRASE